MKSSFIKVLTGLIAVAGAQTTEPVSETVVPETQQPTTAETPTTSPGEQSGITTPPDATNGDTLEPTAQDSQPQPQAVIEVKAEPIVTQWTGPDLVRSYTEEEDEEPFTYATSSGASDWSWRSGQTDLVQMISNTVTLLSDERYIVDVVSLQMFTCYSRGEVISCFYWNVDSTGEYLTLTFTHREHAEMISPTVEQIPVTVDVAGSITTSVSTKQWRSWRDATLVNQVKDVEGPAHINEATTYSPQGFTGAAEYTVSDDLETVKQILKSGAKHPGKMGVRVQYTPNGIATYNEKDIEVGFRSGENENPKFESSAVTAMTGQVASVAMITLALLASI